MIGFGVAEGNYVVEAKGQVTPGGDPSQAIEVECTIEGAFAGVLDRQRVHASGRTTTALLAAFTTAPGGEAISLVCGNLDPSVAGTLDNIELTAIKVDPLFQFGGLSVGRPTTIR